MKIIFMGTPEFAVPTLEALIKNGYDVCLAVTQPDKPKGRGNKITPAPVKETAAKYGIDVIQPYKVKNQEFTDTLSSYKADLIVTAAYGKILTQSALESAKLGCINVHASLLPKYRGAAPLWHVLMNGEKKTGITIMYTDEGIDTGDIIEKSEFEIPGDMTVGELSAEMSKLGAKTLISVLEKLKNGEVVRTKQNNEEASYAPIMAKTAGHIIWDKPAEQIHNLVRGTNPWPAAYTFFKGDRMKIYKTAIINEANEFDESDESKNSCKAEESGEPINSDTAKPGMILNVNDGGILVKTGKGSILIKEIQFDSSRKMEVKDYIKGHKMEAGAILGEIF